MTAFLFRLVSASKDHNTALRTLSWSIPQLLQLSRLYVTGGYTWKCKNSVKNIIHIPGVVPPVWKGLAAFPTGYTYVNGRESLEEYMEFYTLPAFLTLEMIRIIDGPVLWRSFPQRWCCLRIDCSSKVQKLEREDLWPQKEKQCTWQYKWLISDRAVLSEQNETETSGKMLRYSIYRLKSAMLQLIVCYKMVLFKREEISLSKRETVGSDGT